MSDPERDRYRKALERIAGFTLPGPISPRENPTTVAMRRMARKALDASAKSDPEQDLDLMRAAFIARLRGVARDCGYAVGVHGSEERDLDLIAAPWAPEACGADQLVTHLCEQVGLAERAENVCTASIVSPNPEPKPWCRLAYSLDDLTNGTRLWEYIDLSVAPRAGEPVPVVQWRDRRAA